ncbi:MAG: hypothetical protein CVV42_12125 [Candidatus Riflebacteria bacterium HGW-Riflebacteria-2]|nr:MAG: hypothetical protein CVV42_12125 [Candidatus Riflebacteria bacterium HGW-Riflebacteria-2]
MRFASRQLCFLSLLLTLSLLLAPFVEAAELSLFQRLKLKTQQKVEQLKDGDWWITKAASSAAGFVVGKAGGAIGAGIGYVLGAAVGGPLAAGMGAMLGFRIGDIVTKTFAKAISALVTQWKLKEGRKVDLGAVIDATRTVNKASLTADAIGAVIGDLIGGTMGAAAGIALFSCGGPLVLPIIGTIAAATIGSKLGKSIGGSIGRWIGRKILKKGYEAYAASGSSEGKEEATVEPGLVKIEEPAPPFEVEQTEQAGAAAPQTSTLKQVHADYENAYREYTDAVTSITASEYEKQQKLQKYRESYDAYRSAIAAGY